MKELKVHGTYEYSCEVCGCKDVEHAHWVKLNTDEVQDVFGEWCDGDNSYCPQCADNTQIIRELNKGE